MARKIHHLVAIRIGMNKMAKSDKYLEHPDETLEWVAKWSALSGAFLETKGHIDRKRSRMLASSFCPT